ncbi:MAG: triose-phosphate isomerase [Pseudomonadota bacterium]
MRQTLVVGNWKMHGTRDSVSSLLQAVLAELPANGVEAAVCPSYVHIEQAVEFCAGSSLAVGAQDCSHVAAGAYTGEVSAQMLSDSGCQWVILGHSERRQYHSESDNLVAAKLGAAIAAGLKPILCVGESREQREQGEADSVVAAQLSGALAEQGNLTDLVVAYEPVWAIGTGLTATPEQAQEMHAFIRHRLADVEVVDASATRLLYGGSVKPDNARALFAQPDIDGALVGGAALKADDFLAIVRAETV